MAVPVQIDVTGLRWMQRAAPNLTLQKLINGFLQARGNCTIPEDGMLGPVECTALNYLNLPIPSACDMKYMGIMDPARTFEANRVTNVADPCGRVNWEHYQLQADWLLQKARLFGLSKNEFLVVSGLIAAGAVGAGLGVWWLVKRRKRRRD